MRNHPPLLTLTHGVALFAVASLASCLPAPADRGADATFSRSPVVLELEAPVGGEVDAVITVHHELGNASSSVAASASATWLSVEPETASLVPGTALEFGVRARCTGVEAIRSGWIVLEGGDAAQLVPVRLACRPPADADGDAEADDAGDAGDAGEDAVESEALLRWEPPMLEDPVLVRLGTEPDAIELDPDTDYIIELPDRPLVRGLNIGGGRNVVIMGGEVAIPWQGAAPSIASRRALHVTHATGTVHIEGLLLHGDDISEGIQINAPEAILQIQNVGVFDIRARDQVDFSDNHPDLIQSYGNAREIRVDRFTGSTDYQGFFFQADYHGPYHGPVSLSRVNIIGAATARYLLWFSPASGDIVLNDVWLEVPAERSGGLGRAVWPDVTGEYPAQAQVQHAERQAASWPASTSPAIEGRVLEGRPPGGDFVRPERVGIGYESPGYRVGTERAPEGANAGP